MKTKLVYVLIIIAMVSAIGVGIWVMFPPTQMEPIKKYVVAPLKEDAPTELTDAIDTSASGKQFTPEELALEGKETFLAQMEFVGVDTENDPYWKALYEAVNSPEYLEYQKKQDARIGTDLDLWWSFLESKGLSSGRMAQEERFREYFSIGEYADYEPEMRKRLAELFLETGFSSTATNDEASVRQTIGVLSQFRSEAEETVSGCADISRICWRLRVGTRSEGNAVSIVTEADSVDILPVFTESDTVVEPTPTDVAEESSGDEPELLLLSEEAPTIEDVTQVPPTIEEIEAELLKTLSLMNGHSPRSRIFKRSCASNFHPNGLTPLYRR